MDPYAVGRAKGLTPTWLHGDMVLHLGSLLCGAVDGRIRVQKFQQAIYCLAVGRTFTWIQMPRNLSVP